MQLPYGCLLREYYGAWRVYITVSTPRRKAKLHSLVMKAAAYFRTRLGLPVAWRDWRKTYRFTKLRKSGIMRYLVAQRHRGFAAFLRGRMRRLLSSLTPRTIEHLTLRERFIRWNGRVRARRLMIRSEVMLDRLLLMDNVFR